MTNIKDGDVFRWYYKDDSAYRSKCPNGTAYWCMDNQCFATIRDGVTYLIDTYWAHYGCEYIGNEVKIVDIERVDLEFICNLNEIEWVSEYYIQDYDKVYNLSRQSRSYKHYAVDKGAQPSKAAILKKITAERDQLVRDVDHNQWRIKMLNEQIGEMTE